MVRSCLLLLLGTLAFPTLLFSKTGGKSASKDTPAVLEQPVSSFAGGFQQRMYKSASGDSLRYLLFVPKNYTPKKYYPVVLWLHGRGARGNDLNALLSWGNKHGPLFFARPENQKNYPCFIVAPQCPPGELWAGPWSHPSSRQEKLIVKMLKHLRSRYKIDSKRQYVVGISMGGFGAWDLIGRYPKTFAAAMPMCGGGYPKRASRLKNTAIWAFHGKKDEAVSPKRSREMVEAAKKSGAEVRYTEYDGVGHEVWEPAFKEPELLSWLFARRRK
ncbi:MAG: dienelactone hydrolase family protein [candidate division Zixibacteria bacterium]|nr:dienelactone hydrolase family protein [candidate division Zixibacteria bacterium]MCI0595147.1 dienelactone hydrolase family protein [candidate division Zixibacteria bacterium]